jgi:SNF2 family DNA or RNA helicase
MTDKIQVGYEEKLRRLTFAAPFWASDVLRAFPSRRFDPKSKKWKCPLSRQNIGHLNDIRGRYAFEFTPEALEAILNYEALLVPVTYKQFPRDWFDHRVTYQPYDHQWKMLDFGWNLDSYALIAAMGTGKTFVTINLAMARHATEGLRRLTIITLKNLANTWRKEFAKYADPDKYLIRRIQSGKSAQLADWMAEDPQKLHVLLVGVEGLGVSTKYYDTVCAFYLNRVGKHMTVVDESSKIANYKAIRTERTINFGHAQSDWRVFLNGTPINKQVGNLWPQYEFLDPNIIGSGDYWAFKTRYLVMGGYEAKKIVGYQFVEELLALVNPYTLSVPKSVLDLPPKVYKQIYVEATPEQRSLFKQIIKGKGDNPAIKVSNVLERDLRLQQVIGGSQPILLDNGSTQTIPLDSNPKFDAMMDVIEEHVGESKFVIWSRFVPELEMIIYALRTKYGTKSVLSYYGAVSDVDRTAAEERYCNDPDARFFVGNPAAAGLGLTLVSGEEDVMIYYSGTFAYIDRMQSEDRSHRIGQKHTCLVIDLIMENTLDEAIAASIAEKTDLDQFFKRKIEEGKQIDDLLMGEVG